MVMSVWMFLTSNVPPLDFSSSDEAGGAIVLPAGSQPERVAPIASAPAPCSNSGLVTPSSELLLVRRD